MRARGFDAVLVLASWALVAVPAVMLVRDQTHYIEGWLIAATVLPLLGLLIRHYRLSGYLDRRSRNLEARVSQLELAEELAGFGRWSIDLATGQSRWSEEFCNIAGLPAGTPPEAGLIDRLLPDGRSQMDATFASHGDDREAFAVEFEIENPQRGPRILRARARNCFSPEGDLEMVLMVVRDVTDEYTQVARMEQEKDCALREAEEARQLANTDALTGLANRRSAMAALDRAIVEARSAGTAIALIVFDIDHFKQVNDTHGHSTGDRVIATIGEIAGRQARAGQLVARIGGEEFLMVIAGATPQGASGAAERLRLAIEAGTALSPVPPVTVSVGHAMMEAADTSLTLFARADEALYAAKRAGRNRVALAA